MTMRFTNLLLFLLVSVPVLSIHSKSSSPSSVEKGEEQAGTSQGNLVTSEQPEEVSSLENVAAEQNGEEIIEKHEPPGGGSDKLNSRSLLEIVEGLKPGETHPIFDSEGNVRYHIIERLRGGKTRQDDDHVDDEVDDSFSSSAPRFSSVNSTGFPHTSLFVKKTYEASAQRAQADHEKRKMNEPKPEPLLVFKSLKMVQDPYIRYLREDGEQRYSELSIREPPEDEAPEDEDHEAHHPHGDQWMVYKAMCAKTNEIVTVHTASLVAKDSHGGRDYIHAVKAYKRANELSSFTVKLLDHFYVETEEGGRVFGALVLEYMNQGTLVEYTTTKYPNLKHFSQYSSHDNRVYVAKMKRCIKQVLGALASLHASSIAVLNISPKSIFLKMDMTNLSGVGHSGAIDCYLGALHLSRQVQRGGMLPAPLKDTSPQKAKIGIIGERGYIGPELVAMTPVHSHDMFSMGVVMVDVFHSVKYKSAARMLHAELDEPQIIPDNVTSIQTSEKKLLFKPGTAAKYVTQYLQDLNHEFGFGLNGLKILTNKILSKLLCERPRIRMKAKEVLKVDWFAKAPDDISLIISIGQRRWH